ncbi:MAG: hypothetical protein PHP52_10755 [Bacteroidales bacterium]|nr:hypothetical protein [Bacteroidales bacterium]MDD4217125.1 hypothetical protein [Bacteroidales bacterium]MDY0142379.1 hypothetical protein [Bacteroidales bacterium]
MTKLVMENAIFTSKDILEISNQFSNINERLNAIADRLKETTGISLYFCEIIGSRWSFCAGDMTLDIPEHRIKISEKYGIMTGEISMPENQWTKILNSLKEFVKK